jgi:hypothetical protein
MEYVHKYILKKNVPGLEVQFSYFTAEKTVQQDFGTRLQCRLWNRKNSTFPKILNVPAVAFILLNVSGKFLNVNCFFSVLCRQ